MNEYMLRKMFSKMPVIHTPRLMLRRINVSDSHDMFEYAHCAEVTLYLLWSPHPDAEYTRRYLEQLQSDYRRGEFYDWAVVYKQNGKMIGTCGFTAIDLNNNRAEIGYVLNPAYWGLSIAPEAASAVIGFGFDELKLNRIEARYMAGNSRSRRVMEKCGMTFEGIQRSLIYVKNEYRDIGVCSILSTEYYKIM